MHAPHEVALRFTQLGLLRELPFAALQDAPSWLRALIDTAGDDVLTLGTAGDVLWVEPALLRADPRWVRGWLRSGAVLSFGETGELESALAPTVIAASAQWYDALAADVRARAARTDFLTRRLVSWALAGHELARSLVVSSLVDRLGLRNVSRAFVVGAPSASSSALFSALGLGLRPIEHAVSEPLSHAEPLRLAEVGT